MTTTRKTFYSEIYNFDDIPAKHRPCLIGLGQKFPAEENHVFGCYSAKTGPKKWGHI